MVGKVKPMEPCAYARPAKEVIYKNPLKKL